MIEHCGASKLQLLGLCKVSFWIDYAQKKKHSLTQERPSLLSIGKIRYPLAFPLTAMSFLFMTLSSLELPSRCVV